MRFILSLIITGIIISLAVYFTPGAHVQNFIWAIIAGLIIGLVNGTIGSVLRLITFPINFLTLGLISFLITVLMLSFADFLMGSKFVIGGFLNTVIFAIIIAIFEMILGSILGLKKK